MTNEELARLMELERAKPMPSSSCSDERFEELYYARVKEESGEKAYQAQRRLIRKMRGKATTAGLFRRLVNAEAASRGWV